MSAPPLKAPFPWFGGKSRVSHLVWNAFGDVSNYVEPFAGSLAVLLGRPHEPHTETVNDLDGLLINFWRACAWAPDEVALHADWPVSEADLSARHLVLVERRPDLTERLAVDAEFFDAKLAGWWVWGACAWIGSGWCDGNGPWVRGEAGLRKLPHLGDAGVGINRQLPHLGDAGRGVNRLESCAKEWIAALAERLRRVRFACGDWGRVLGDSVTWRHGVTGVFLDPPYEDGAMDYSVAARGTVSADVREWAIANGCNKKLRIALCGYEGEHEMPSDWQCVAWKARGGYGNQGGDDAEDNRHRERIWFSPHCARAEDQADLFGGLS